MTWSETSSEEYLARDSEENIEMEWSVHRVLILSSEDSVYFQWTRTETEWRNQAYNYGI